MIPTKLAFEKMYPDGSGVEFAVRYDATDVDQIKIERVTTACFPIEQLDWLIDSLISIKNSCVTRDP